MNFITLIGFVAGTLTTIAFLPQLLHTWRSKSSQDISFAMMVCLVTGVALWFVYGVFLRALPIIVANAVTLVLSASILILKLTHKN